LVKALLQEEIVQQEDLARILGERATSVDTSDSLQQIVT
jgi:hypothetical protein